MRGWGKVLVLLGAWTVSACVLRPGSVRLVVESVAEWDAPGDVVRLRWAGRGWLGWVPAEGQIVYWPDAGGPASPVRWRDERWRSPVAWAGSGEGVLLATESGLWLFPYTGGSPEALQTWPEGTFAWDDGRRLWVVLNSDRARICGPTGRDAVECWTVSRERLPKPTYAAVAWTWSPPWWCDLQLGPTKGEGHERTEAPVVGGGRTPGGEYRAGFLRCFRLTPSGADGGGPEPALWRAFLRFPDAVAAESVRLWVVGPWLLVSTGRWMWAWEVERGRLRWRLDLGASVAVPPVLAGPDELVVATRGLLVYGVGARSGDRRWVLPLRHSVLDLQAGHFPDVRVPAWVALTRLDAPPLVVEAGTGRTIWEASGWTAWCAALAEAAGRVAWAGTDGRVRVFRVRPSDRPVGP